jgi:hypothetical protein
MGRPNAHTRARRSALTRGGVCKTGALRDCVEGWRLPYSPSLSTHPAVRLPSPPCRLAPSSTPTTAAAPPLLAARARPSRRDSSRTRGGGNPSDRSTRRREPWRTMITMKLTLGSPSLSLMLVSCDRRNLGLVIASFFSSSLPHPSVRTPPMARSVFDLVLDM